MFAEAPVEPNFWTDYEHSEIVQWVRDQVTGKNERTSKLGIYMHKAPMFERVRTCVMHELVHAYTLITCVRSICSSSK